MSDMERLIAMELMSDEDDELDVQEGEDKRVAMRPSFRSVEVNMSIQHSKCNDINS